METKEKGLSNLQLELLKLYGANISETSLEEVKDMLARYFANRASDEMDAFWDKNGIVPEDMMHWADGHERAKNRP